MVEMRPGCAVELVPSMWVSSNRKEVHFPDPAVIDTYTVQTMVEKSSPVNFKYFITRECILLFRAGEIVSRLF